MLPQPSDDEERLNRITEALEEINAKGLTHIVLVEGMKDIAALQNSGVDAQFFCVQSGGGPVRAAESVWKSGRSAIILTDWDRRGNRLAEALESNLASLGVPFDTEIRSTLASLCRPYAKDVESIDTVILRLNRQILESRRGGRMKGRIIVLEGIDGSGKSTVCSMVARILERKGYGTVVTAEPTRDRIGGVIRSGAMGGMSQRTEALLFLADRSDHTEAMERWAGEGKVVICDRYFASTLAYQSSDLDGEGIDRDWLVSASKPFVGKPDLTVLLDIDPEASLARVSSRGEEISKFERLDFLRRVRGEYLRLAELHGFAVIDASRGLDQVVADVLSRIEEVL